MTNSEGQSALEEARGIVQGIRETTANPREWLGTELALAYADVLLKIHIAETLDQLVAQGRSMPGIGRNR